MEFLIFAKEYYTYLLTFLFFCVAFSFLSEFKQDRLTSIINNVSFLFIIFLILFFGSRDFEVGVDVIRYQRAYEYYSNSDTFEVEKDIFYDFITFVLSKFITFKVFLIFCASIYFFGFYFGLKKIFKNNVYIPLVLLFISPYFVANGVSAIRSGMAASVFTFGLGLAYQKKSNLKVFSIILISVLLHISMIVPVLFFLVTKFFKNTKLIFVFWLFSFILSLLNINIVILVVDKIGFLAERASFYAVNEGTRSYWDNFLIFGLPPVLFAVYYILSRKIIDKNYIHLVNAYMLIHIPYIILLNSEYGLRLGYLAEFMLPIILCWPLLKFNDFKVRALHFKIVLVLTIIFLIKSYKVFTAPEGAISL